MTIYVPNFFVYSGIFFFAYWTSSFHTVNYFSVCYKVNFNIIYKANFCPGVKSIAFILQALLICGVESDFDF
jgi:hypothetical protein